MAPRASSPSPRQATLLSIVRATARALATARSWPAPVRKRVLRVLHDAHAVDEGLGVASGTYEFGE